MFYHLPRTCAATAFSQPYKLETIAPLHRAVLRQLRHPAIVEFKGVGAMHIESAEAMRRSMFLVQVWSLAQHGAAVRTPSRFPEVF